jgi:hypothetical protein
VPLTLTPEFERALAILHDGGNLFLTGKAGTGKSTLIRHFLAATDRRVVVAVPTGIAALNVEGYTIHRLFGFRPTTSVDDVRRGGYRPGRFASTLRSLDALIIDEASMVRADLFDMLVAALERFGPRPGTAYGGVQLVLVGDLLQLPPVVRATETDYFQTRYATPYFFSADSFDRAHFPTVSLTTVFRQLGDQRLTAILNAVREGVLLAHAQEEINARTIPDFVPPEDELWLTLAPTNTIVTARNRERLERLPGEEHLHVAVRSGSLEGFEAPTDDKLRFKVGAQVMMLTNDGADRWVNGTLGKVVHIDDRDGSEVTVVFTDGSSATITPYTWEVTVPRVVDGRVEHEVVGAFTQLPFKLAWAITIHKSQGQTLDRMIVDLSGGAFDFGQVYVALSRCTSMAGLVLKRPVLAKDLKTDRRVIRFLRASDAAGGARRHCSVAILTVGDEGRMSRPRPVELALSFDDGTAISTLINPQRDLADARRAYGVATDDVLLAPTLAEAWTALAPLLEGVTPTGVGVDETLALIDFELKRLGLVTPLPLGLELHGPAPADGTALARARAMLRRHEETATQDVAEPFGPLAGEASTLGYLLTRDPAVEPPRSAQLPWVGELLDVSRAVSAAVLDGATADEARALLPTAWDPSVRALLGERLAAVVTRIQVLPPGLAARLAQVEELLGLPLLAAAAGTGRPPIAEALAAGARICFTGEAQDADGRGIPRPELEERARGGGLSPVGNVSKTRCDVLIVAEIGTQSGKAKKALEFGKPVYSVAEFLAWCG